MYTVGILTISDKGAAGKREDAGGLLLHQLVERLPGKVVVYQVVPDEEEAIRSGLLSFCDEWGVELAITTGGTGVSPRDVTPEATLQVIERLIPGMGEIMRIEGFRKNPRAIISRGVAGIRKKTLIINLPGSPRAVRENFELLLPSLSHAIDKIKGDDAECGAP
ncbi:MAG TPA: MogA/MoaB family molybdenum cofactor biosynthesis protein [Candidatus Manganitrophaceae bacterium]|nr:MogA/MoaB family molybdenum cofactor biosynthesis protein [Candidatus Manganitrophaceae bacterium]